MKKIKFNEIKIPDYMNEPSIAKLIKKRKRFNRSGHYDKLVINYDGYLVDGYATYTLMKMDGFDEEMVEYRSTKYRTKGQYEQEELSYKNNPTVYIEGVHLNSNCVETYTWRLTNTFIEDNGITDEKSLIGKNVIAQTKFGLAPVRITNVMYLDKPPAERRIKKAIKILED